MKYAICGIMIDSMDDAMDEGWEHYFYDGETEYEFACPGCTETFLQEGQDGEWEVKEEYRGKIRFAGEGKEGKTGGHLGIGITIKGPDGEKH
jgi:hypothetical protein